uniref:Uncharacterized protein n=1 Tax=Rhizophora mucronata TaxID=61149 RepID=A0A2P2NJP7_RHIMU
MQTSVTITDHLIVLTCHIIFKFRKLVATHVSGCIHHRRSKSQCNLRVNTSSSF